MDGDLEKASQKLDVYKDSEDVAHFLIQEHKDSFLSARRQNARDDSRYLKDQTRVQLETLRAYTLENLNKILSKDFKENPEAYSDQYKFCTAVVFLEKLQLRRNIRKYLHPRSGN